MATSLTEIFDAKAYDQMRNSIRRNVQAIEVDSAAVSPVTLAACGYDGRTRKAPKKLKAYFMPKHNLLRTAVIAA